MGRTISFRFPKTKKGQQEAHALISAMMGKEIPPWGEVKDEEEKRTPVDAEAKPEPKR